MIDTNTSKTRTVASTELIKRAKLSCPVKQSQALLESNPPTDNWIERRRNKYVSTFGEAKTSPNAKKHTFISEPEHALKTHLKFKPISKNHLKFKTVSPEIALAFILTDAIFSSLL